MKAIKTSIILSIPNNKTSNNNIHEFFTDKEPTKEYIKEKVEKDLGISLEIRNTSPDEGGDFGAFFFYNDMYVTYRFKEIEIGMI